MKLEITREDPLKVLVSTKRVVERARHVWINEGKLSDIAKKIAQKLENEGLESVEDVFGIAGDYEKDVQLIFIEDAVNFCFWEEKGKEKWCIEWQGKHIQGGWYAVAACFKRALAADSPILEASFLSDFNIAQAHALFSSSNGIDIPLIEKRVNNIREVGRVLLKKYDGLFVNVLKAADYDAVKLVQLIARDFSSFRDVFQYKGGKVYFFKRAQIAAFDVSYLNRNNFDQNLTNTDKLTAFADYKIPQMLRRYRVLEYSKELAEKVDNYVLLPSGGDEEIEIRAASIWGVELISHYLNGRYSAGAVDNALWFLSQAPSDQTKPYHRTYSIYY